MDRFKLSAMESAAPAHRSDDFVLDPTFAVEISGPGKAATALTIARSKPLRVVSQMDRRNEEAFGIYGPSHGNVSGFTYLGNESEFDSGSSDDSCLKYAPLCPKHAASFLKAPGDHKVSTEAKNKSDSKKHDLKARKPHLAHARETFQVKANPVGHAIRAKNGRDDDTESDLIDLDDAHSPDGKGSLPVLFNLLDIGATKGGKVVNTTIDLIDFDEMDNVHGKTPLPAGNRVDINAIKGQGVQKKKNAPALLIDFDEVDSVYSKSPLPAGNRVDINAIKGQGAQKKKNAPALLIDLDDEDIVDDGSSLAFFNDSEMSLELGPDIRLQREMVPSAPRSQSWIEPRTEKRPPVPSFVKYW